MKKLTLILVMLLLLSGCSATGGGTYRDGGITYYEVGEDFPVFCSAHINAQDEVVGLYHKSKSCAMKTGNGKIVEAYMGIAIEEGLKKCSKCF